MCILRSFDKDIDEVCQGEVDIFNFLDIERFVERVEVVHLILRKVVGKMAV